MLRKLVIPVAVAALTASFVVTSPATGQEAGSGQVTIIHDSHFHGKFGDPDLGEDGLPAPGRANIARYFSLVEQLKAAHGDTALYLMNGDDIAPSVYSGIFEPHGVHMVDALNAVTGLIDVNTFGNHEFDFGPANLEEILQLSTFPWVTANVRDATDLDEVFGAAHGVTEYVILDVDGVMVGVTGLAPEAMGTITTLGDAAVQIPAGEALDMVVPKMLADGADIVVVTSHQCSTDVIVLADTRSDVDVYVGDHCAQVLDEPYVSPTGAIVSLVGDEFRFLGELTLTVEQGNITDFDFILHNLAVDHPTIPAHPGVQAVVDHYDEMLDEELGVVIGVREVDWDTRTLVIRTGENALGNYFTDEMRTAFGGSDIAVTNSGGLRGNTVYPAGDITRFEIAEILPFGNRLVQASLSGQTLLEALEHSVSLYPDPNGGLLQVSGLEMVFDPDQPAGSRVVSVMVGGAPLDPAATYTMATNDFTLGGGDGFTMFRDDTTVLVDANAGPVLDVFIMDRIEHRHFEPITTDIEGRIRLLADVEPNMPTSRADCKNGGWRDVVDDVGNLFANQGRCVAFVSSGRAAR